MRRLIIYILLSVMGLCLAPRQTEAQTVQALPQAVELTLDQAIATAIDSSLNSLLAQNQFLASYWQYRSYKAERLPSLSFSSTPMQYHQTFVKRYDSQNNIDVYKQQKSIYSSAGLCVQQNMVWTGGVFSLETNLDFLQNFGMNTYTQFSSVPVRLGYSQSLFGFNPFKWSKKIEPLEYERAQKELVYEFENIAGWAISYFFNQAMNQMLYEMSVTNVAQCDTAYLTGLERQKIGNITQADLLALKLNAINARNRMEDSKMNLDKSTFALASFLRYAPDTQFNLTLPTDIPSLTIVPEEALVYAKDGNPKMQELALEILRARENLERVQKSRFSSLVSLSVGFNQVADRIGDVYSDPLRQDGVSVSFSIPILDWGRNRGQVNMAKSTLNIALISKEQAEEAFEQEVILAVKDFNMRYKQIVSAHEARQVAELAYEATYQRFLIGKADVNTLSIAQSRRTDALQSYISAIASYWAGYYAIRKYTLYDFLNDRPIKISVDRILANKRNK